MIQPSRQSSAEAEDNPDFIQYYLEQPILPEFTRHSASQMPYVGKPLNVKVPTSLTTARSFFLWRYTRFYQYDKLVVIVEYQDGKRQGRVVDIPDLHESRTVTVEVP